MIKFVHMGDIHLGLRFNFSLNYEKARDRRRELWASFERVVKYTEENNMDFLFIAGDLFEQRYFTLGDMKRVSETLNKIKEVNVVIVAGNHDILREDSLYNKVHWEENITIFNSEKIDKKIFKDLNTIVYGYSWDKIEIKENLLFEDFEGDERDFNRILIIHGDVRRESDYLPLDINTLESLDMDYIALGHIHKPEKIRDNIAYCGSLEPLDFGEIGPRGFMQGEIYKGRTKVKFAPFSKREFKEVSIDLNENMGYLDIIEKFTDLEEKTRLEDFFRIKLKGYRDRDLNLENLEYELRDEFYHLEIIDNSVPDYDLEAIATNYEHSIIGEFIQAMKELDLENQRVKHALYYGLDALLKEKLER